MLGDPTKKEEGGRVYDLRRKGVKLEGEAQEGTIIELIPGRNDVDLGRVHVGDRIWKTNDPALDKRLRSRLRRRSLTGYSRLALRFGVGVSRCVHGGRI